MSGSLFDLEDGVNVLLDRRYAQQRSDGLGYTSVSPDDLALVLRRYLETYVDAFVVTLFGHADLIGIGRYGTCNIFDEFLQASSFTLSRVPIRRRMPSTASVG